MIYIELSKYYILKTAYKKCRSKSFPSVEFGGWVLVGILTTGALLIWWYS